MTTCPRCENTNGFILQGSGSNVRARRCDHRQLNERKWWDTIDDEDLLMCLTCRAPLTGSERRWCSPACRLEYKKEHAK
jgi:hypothetical protein